MNNLERIVILQAKDKVNELLKFARGMPSQEKYPFENRDSIINRSKDILSLLVALEENSSNK